MEVSETKIELAVSKTNLETVRIVLPTQDVQSRDAHGDTLVAVPRIERSESCF